MAQTAPSVLKWRLLGRSRVPDISTLPTRIQDIPKEILRMYGIVVGNEEPIVHSIDSDDDDDDDDDPVLIIDEPPLKIQVEIMPSGKLHQSDEPKPLQLTFSPPSTENTKETKVSNSGERTNAYHTPLTTFTNTKMFPLVSYCDLCKKLVTDISFEEHKRKHCFQAGCLDLILDDVDLARHLKMHEHPTKPFMCRTCKKRYRYYCNVEKHSKVCKSVWRAKQNWRKTS